MSRKSQLQLYGATRWFKIYGGLLKTRQLTPSHVGDDGDYKVGLDPSYTVLNTSAQAGTTNIDLPHYAAATLAFVAATKKITDSANGLATFLTGDTIRVRGSGSNDGIYTVATGGVAAEIVTTEALVNEGAGAYVTLCKRAAPSNNLVVDNTTGLVWRRYCTGTTGSAEKIGPVSDGKACFYDVAMCFTLHPAAADLQMMTTGIKIVGGAAQIARYFVGAILVFSGFANAVNNLPGYRITSVAVNGGDLDILLWTCKNTLIAEAAGGSRDIKIICRSTFAYVAASNAVAFAGYSDWRVPNMFEYNSLMDFETPDAKPNAVAFPNWPALYFQSATTQANFPTNDLRMYFLEGSAAGADKTYLYFLTLVRGGT